MLPTERWNTVLFPPITGEGFWSGLFSNADPKDIGIQYFQILRNLVHLRKGELATRPGFSVLSDVGSLLTAAPLGLFRHYTDEEDKYSVVIDPKTSDARLLYKKNDNIVTASAWTLLDADFFDSDSDRVRGIDLKGSLWLTNGVEPMKYFKDEEDYGVMGVFKPHLQNTIGTPVFSEVIEEKFEACGIFQYRQRFVYDEEGGYSNPGPVTHPYLYQWDYKENGLKSLTLSNLSVGAEFMNSAADDIITKRIISTVIERRFKKYDNEFFGAWSRIDILNGIQSTSYVDSYPDPSVPIVGDFSEPPIAKYLTTARDCLIGFNLLGAKIPIPFDQADDEYPKYAELGLADRVKIRIKNNTGTTATDAIVTLTDLQWGNSANPLYIDYDDGGANAGKDFQFTDDDGITPLYSFRTAYNDVANTVSFKVRVPEIIAYEEKVIYLYYNGADCNADDNTNWRNVYHRKYLNKEHLALFNMDVDDADVLYDISTKIANKVYDRYLILQGNSTRATGGVEERALGFPFGGIAKQSYNCVATTLGATAITAFTSYASGTQTQVTSVGHERLVDDLIELHDCDPAGYDGFYHIAMWIDANNFVIDLPFVSGGAGTGSWRTPADGFLDLFDTSGYAYSNTTIVTPGSYVNGSIKFKFKWDGGVPNNQEYTMFFYQNENTGSWIKIFLKHTTVPNEQIRATLYYVGVVNIQLCIDTEGGTGGDVFDGGWWYLVLSWDENGAYLRVKSIAGFEDKNAVASILIEPVSFVNDGPWRLGNLGALGANCFIDEFEVTLDAISDEQFDCEFLRETFATAPTITLEEPEDVSEREELPDAWAFSLPNRPHIFPSDNIRYTGFGEGKGMQYFLNSLYLYHKNKIIRGNISGGNQLDWDCDYTFSDKLTIPGMSISGLVADNGLLLFRMLGGEFQGWVSDGGILASAGGDPINISEPINNIFRDMNYAELQHSTLSYSPKLKQLFLGIASGYQTETSAGAGEPEIKDVRTNEDNRPYNNIQQKSFAIDNAGTAFCGVVDWTALDPRLPLRKLYKKLEAGDWALATNPDVVTGVDESTKDWRSMSMYFDKARRDLHFVTNADDDTLCYIIHNKYTVATNTWGTALNIATSTNWLMYASDIVLDINDRKHIVFIKSGLYSYTYRYYYEDASGNMQLIIPDVYSYQEFASICVNVLNQSDIVIIACTVYANFTKLYAYQNGNMIASVVISNFINSCMYIDEHNNIYLIGRSTDVLRYVKVKLVENSFIQSAIEDVLTSELFSDYCLSVRRDIPHIFYINAAADEIYYIKRENGNWGDAVALDTSGTSLNHLTLDQTRLPDGAIPIVQHCGFMDEIVHANPYRVKCWQNTTYILESSALDVNYYVEKIYCLDLNDEVMKQNGGVDFVWSEFTSNTADSRMPIGIPCLWDGLDDNRELLFTGSNSAKIFAYGEREGNKSYLDEFATGIDLIIPISFKTADMKYYNDIFDELCVKYNDLLRNNSMNLRIYLDKLLLMEYNNYPSNEIIALPLHSPAQTIAIEMSADTNYGKTVIERMEYKHQTIAR